MKAKDINFGGLEINGIRVLRMIGQGNWADVYLAEDVASLEKFAVKTTSHRKFSEVPKLLQLVKAEISILKACKNPHVVRLIKEFNHQEHQFIVMEYCNGLELADVLKQEKRLEEPTATIYLKQILDGFRGLHEVHAMHRDFKAENVMLHDGICKLVDLGFGKQLFEGDVARTKLGSNLTMAPQVMQGLPYDFGADLWSIGIVYYQMLFGKFPFQARTTTGLLERTRNHDFSFEGEDISENAKDFISKCLKFDPEQRLTWIQVYKHPLILEQEIFGFAESKIDVQENSKFYESNLRILEKQISYPSNFLKFSQNPSQNRFIESYSKPQREESRVQIKIQEQQSIAEVLKDPIPKSKIFKGSQVSKLPVQCQINQTVRFKIKQPASYQIAEQEMPQKEEFPPFKRQESYKHVKEQKKSIKQMEKKQQYYEQKYKKKDLQNWDRNRQSEILDNVKTIRYKYSKELENILFMPRYAIQQIDMVSMQEIKGHLFTIVCNMLQESYNKLFAIRTNFRTNEFSCDLQSFGIFLTQYGPDLEKIIDDDLKDIKQKFANYKYIATMYYENCSPLRKTVQSLKLGLEPHSMFLYDWIGSINKRILQIQFTCGEKSLHALLRLSFVVSRFLKFNSGGVKFKKSAIEALLIKFDYLRAIHNLQKMYISEEKSKKIFNKTVDKHPKVVKQVVHKMKKRFNYLKQT